MLCQSNALLLELVTLKKDKGLAFAFLSVVDLDSKTSTLLLCGPREVSLARAAFPDGEIVDACAMDTSADCGETLAMLAALRIDAGA